MRALFTPRRVSSASIVLVIWCAITPAAWAQWTKIPETGPRTTDGKSNLSAPAPKRADGTPDLSGVWTGPGGRFVQDLAADLKPGEVSYQPWAKALVDERVRQVEAFGGRIDDAAYAALQRPRPWLTYFTSGGRLLLRRVGGQAKVRR